MSIFSLGRSDASTLYVFYLVKIGHSYKGCVQIQHVDRHLKQWDILPKCWRMNNLPQTGRRAETIGNKAIQTFADFWIVKNRLDFLIMYVTNGIKRHPTIDKVLLYFLFRPTSEQSDNHTSHQKRVGTKLGIGCNYWILPPIIIRTSNNSPDTRKNKDYDPSKLPSHEEWTRLHPSHHRTLI